MGIDYKKKYLKYKNKYLEAKKIYGGTDPVPQDSDPAPDADDSELGKKFNEEFWTGLANTIQNVDTKMGKVAEIEDLGPSITNLREKASELTGLKSLVKEKSQLAEELELCNQKNATLQQQLTASQQASPAPASQ